MKTLILALVLIVGFSSVALAAVTAEILAKDIDENGNIIVWTTHYIDDIEVESRYPKINGHWVWATRYSKSNLKDFDATQSENFILKDVANYSSVLIQKEFDKSAVKTLNQIRVGYNAAANQAVMDDKLNKLVGKSISTTESEQLIDSDADGVQDKKLKLKKDGTFTEEPYTTPTL